MKLLTQLLKVCSLHICIEKGTSNGWTYKKFADGTFEAWGKFTKTFAISTQSGQCYFSTSQNQITPNIGIDTIEYAMCGYQGGEGVLGKINWIASDGITFALFSTISRTSAARNACLSIKGTYQ